jgi:hypothetical protein
MAHFYRCTNTACGGLSITGVSGFGGECYRVAYSIAPYRPDHPGYTLLHSYYPYRHSAPPNFPPPVVFVPGGEKKTE